MENLLGGKKPQAYNRSKIPLWRAIKVYKDLPSSRSPIPHRLLDKHFHISPPHLHLQEHAWSPSQAWSRPSSWSSIKKKMGFHPNPNEWEMNVQRTQPIFLFRKSVRNFFLEDLNEIFLESKQPPKGKGMKSSLTNCCSLLSIHGINLFLKGKWNT